LPIPPGTDLRLGPRSRERISTDAARRGFLEHIDNMPANDPQRAAFERAVRRSVRRGDAINIGTEESPVYWPRDQHGDAWEVNHEHPLEWGGSNLPENLMALPRRDHDLVTRWWNDLRRLALEDWQVRDQYGEGLQAERILDLVDLLNIGR
jgi:hypothetical protein